MTDLQPRVLIVEDDPELRHALALLLQQNGFQAIEAQDGLNAFSHAVKDAPQLVILDLGLPGGGGLVVMERLRLSRRTAGIPVLVLTGSKRDQDKTRALELGACEFMRKPAQPQELIEAVKRLTIMNKAA